MFRDTKTKTLGKIIFDRHFFSKRNKIRKGDYNNPRDKNPWRNKQLILAAAAPIINNGGHGHHNHDWQSSLSNDRKAPRRASEQRQQDAGSLRTEAGAIPPFHRLPSGLNMEFIFQKGREKNVEKCQHPPLVFVHGSFHAAWCWAEHWLPYFSQHGFDCYALSLLAQGESDSPAGVVAGSLQTHAADVADFIHKEIEYPPVLLGHSFGGLIVQYYIKNVGHEKLQEMEHAHPNLAGAVLVCSVPPSGNSGLVWRYLFSKPIAAFKVTRSLAAKAFQTSLPLCKETFFSPAMEDHLVLRYQKLMTESSRMPLFDLRKLNASLPVPPVKDPSIKILVLGANDDFIVDAEGLNETGRFYGVSAVSVEGVAHDMMLDCSWEKGAQVILSWLPSLDKD